MSHIVNDFAVHNACTHVLYCYQNRESYISNTVNYLLEGIKTGDSVILIESERNLNILTPHLKTKLSESEFENIHTMSNFEFYLSSGSYHPPAIYENLIKSITPFLEENIPFRTWTNVEWGTQDDPAHIVDWFETETDKVVHEHNLTLVCAYEAERMPPDLQSILERTHPHIMYDENLTESLSYLPHTERNKENIQR